MNALKYHEFYRNLLKKTLIMAVFQIVKAELNEITLQRMVGYLVGWLGFMVYQHL